VEAAAASVYVRGEFWTLVVASLLVPVVIFVWLTRRRRISRPAVAFIAVTLVGLSGVDAILLKRLNTIAGRTSSLHDDRVFASEFSLALYLIPLITAGMGINLLSHLLHEHLIIAELEDDRERRRYRGGAAD
jgi:hypothetical protein